MFFSSQDIIQQKEYQEFLRIAGCLSNLFSDSTIPYLHYRIAEKVFCRAFHAEDLSRSDVSADAKKDGLGIGLKTFLIGNNKTIQKVAEFNGDRPLYRHLEPKEQIRVIAELRNERIRFTQHLHGLERSIYHCIVRDNGKFKIFEEAMNFIDIDNIRNIKENTGSIAFNDGLHEYSFLVSKSTLAKRFVAHPITYEFDVDILDDPLAEIQSLLSTKSGLIDTETTIKQTIYLPLYSSKDNLVQEKSGLNQRNAGGRQRHPNEVYIPVPSIIHKNFPTFFPTREITFSLKLPHGGIMQAKICQDDGKALMSDPNRALGEWILRSVLQLQEGELLTYHKLQMIGIDSVRIDKFSNNYFEINFAKIGSFTRFKNLLS